MHTALALVDDRSMSIACLLVTHLQHHDVAVFTEHAAVSTCSATGGIDRAVPRRERGDAAKLRALHEHFAVVAPVASQKIVHSRQNGKFGFNLSVVCARQKESQTLFDSQKRPSDSCYGHDRFLLVAYP